MMIWLGNDVVTMNDMAVVNDVVMATGDSMNG
jgi:hypothetical protein